MNLTEHNEHKPESLSQAVVWRYRFIVLTACSLAMSASIWGWLVASRQLAVEFHWHGILACQIFSLLGYAYYGLTKNFGVLRISQLLFMLIAPLVAQLSMESGSVSAIILWSFLTPISVSMIAAREERHTSHWLVAYVAVVLAAYLLDPMFGSSSQYATDIIVAGLLPVNLAVFAGWLTLALYYSLRHRNEVNQLRKHQYFNLHEQHTQLNTENERTEMLLSSVLPARIAARLLVNPEMIADGHSDVTVMFADIVGFTRLADSMSPKQIVHLLNQIFSGFDEIAERHGLEKIKTIGDAYLAVGGLASRDNLDYVESTLKAALEFQRFIRWQSLAEFGGSDLDVHFGIATGPVAAGVIGKIRLTYDIWGNTVNLASRLADHAVAGQILVDQTTYKRMSKQFDFSDEELLTLKGGNQITMYRLLTTDDPDYPPEAGNAYKKRAHN
jgi:class 3 adenylate cyclase